MKIRLYNPGIEFERNFKIVSLNEVIKIESIQKKEFSYSISDGCGEVIFRGVFDEEVIISLINLYQESNYLLTLFNEKDKYSCNFTIERSGKVNA